MKAIGYVVVGALTFVLGLVAAAVIAKEALPDAMFVEVASPYDHAETVRLIEQHIEDQPGWTLTGAYDHQKAILAGGGGDVGPYVILKFCKGTLAGRMLADDERRFFGVMMPISAAIYTKADGRTYVSLVNGTMLSRFFGGTYHDVINDVRLEVEEIFRFLHLKFTAF
ncbi:MAG: hypothetical protein CVU56_24715 [Deltaproteobacteria bacterium HGW-Deltaproteobacteria-14]|jgi:uncharacterized protein (DUF302 family)|nr:MAG: hypothetical protein CVU56_24715 [Deltaproteobacteria bacterium HGW-Deltaproteobacteria-14]